MFVQDLQKHSKMGEKTMTREEFLRNNQKHRVSDKMKAKMRQRGIKFEGIRYVPADECYYVFMDGSMYYVDIDFVREHECPFDDVVQNVMNQAFMRWLLDPKNW